MALKPFSRIRGALEVRSSAVNGTPNGTLYVDNATTTGQLVGTGPTTNDTTTGGVTLAAAKIINGVYAHTPTAACNDQMDTAANIVAAIPDCRVGSQFEFYLRNKAAGAYTITVTTNTGITLDGTMTVAQANTRFFVGVVTAIGATPTVTIFSMGSQAH